MKGPGEIPALNIFNDQYDSVVVVVKLIIAIIGIIV
jgi:hypothetical protein